VGLVANEDGTFRVILAGSLGAKPGLGVLAYESLPIDEVLPLIVAALRLFHAEGERTNRSRARLRHLREQLGNEVFLARIEELLQIEKRESSWPAPTFRRVEKELPLVDRLVLPLGDISPELVLELMDAVEAVGAEVRLGMEHDLLILGGSKPVLSPKLAVLSGGNVVVACGCGPHFCCIAT
jgi:sulfite reductase beta subunit-like hemoprotein